MSGSHVGKSEGFAWPCSASRRRMYQCRGRVRHNATGRARPLAGVAVAVEEWVRRHLAVRDRKAVDHYQTCRDDKADGRYPRALREFELVVNLYDGQFTLSGAASRGE